jgi:hypothetical protein
MLHFAHDGRTYACTAGVAARRFRNQEFCKQICADREVSCRATGCFPFNKGGSQCDGK